MRIPALLCLLLGSAAGGDFSPELRHVQPRGGQLGAEMTVRLHGERLTEPREILLQKPGIEILSLEEHLRTEEKDGGKHEVRDGKTVVARIRIASDAPLGEHPLRLRTAGGVSYLRNFWVGPFPTVREQEPNDDFEHPQRIESGVTVEGTATLEDIDHYAVALKKGEPLAVEIEAMRLGRGFFDAYIAILDPRGVPLAACDDAPLLRTDAFASIIAPEDGDYRVVVREAAYEGNDACQYRLHVGPFPRPSAVFPPGATPGETVRFRFIGDPGGEITREITIPEDADGLFPVFAIRDGLSSPSPNWIQVAPFPHIAESEPNQNPKQATRVPETPCAIHGILAEPGQNDWFRFPAKKGRDYDIRVLARHLRSPLDSVLSLRDPAGKHLETNDDQDGPDSRIRWKCPDDGDYLLLLRDKLGRAGPDFTYRIEIDHRRPAISASLPTAARNNSQARKMICIPRGNLYATQVNITRSNLACDASFDALSLPDGVTMEVPDVPRSLNQFPVLFRAAADAPVAGGYHRFRIRATGDKAPDVDGPLAEEIHHIEVNNQGAYHSWRSSEIAVAVIEEAPFHLDLASPPTPVVARGTVKLRVGLRRAAGFDGAVNLRLAWRPPGIGAPETVPIKAGADEAHYEINASPDAPVGDWQIAVVGDADTPAGPVSVSSAFVTLQVAEPWLTASIELGATESGRDVPVVCRIDRLRDFSGEARAELLGLPHGATTAPLPLTAATESLTFPVAIADDAALGKHTGLFLRVHVPQGPGTVLHECGQGGTLRIDKPRPKPAETAETAESPAKPGTKPLSRLEQLRREAANP